MTILKQKNNPLIKELNSLYKNLCYYIKKCKKYKNSHQFKPNKNKNKNKE
jgi:arginyl-tRNA--protein-N-Asp/Glu arginylyltransferase